MLLNICKSKIHKIVITNKDLYYQGSIGIDGKLLEAAGILPNEKVQVVNLNNGERFETYCIAEKKGSGIVSLYGPAARLGEVGDVAIVISYALMSEEEADGHKVKIVHVIKGNKAV